MRQSIISALQLFQRYLRGFDGSSIRQSYKQMVSVSEAGFNVLRSPGIAAVFGVNPPPGNPWPIESNDPNGALLIRAVGEKLTLAAQNTFNEERFQRLRRVAQQGRDALIAVLDFKDDAPSDHLDSLITSIYTWAVSLRDYGVR